MKWLLFKLIALLPLWFIGDTAYAGKIILKTELWDFICKVEVALGPDAPDDIEKILQFPGVRIDGEYIDGIVYIGEDRLCYRRTSIAGDCYSVMNNWVCYTNYSDTPETIPIY